MSTVSNILCNSPYSWASQSARKRVFDAVEKVGYRRNRVARGLVLRKTECLGLVIPDQRNPVYAEVVHGVVMGAEKKGYEVFLGSTEDSVEREKEYLERFAERRCEGIILMPVHGLLYPEVVSLLGREGIPWVEIGPPVAGIPGDYIYPQFEEGTYLVTKHLLQLGRKKIAFLAATVTKEMAAPWIVGFRRAVAEAGLTGLCDSVHLCAPDLRSAYETAREMFASASERPDAVVCLNDLSAIAACRAIEDCGLKIPTDVAVVGSDDIEIAAYLHVPLTTVSYDVGLIGAKAVQMLFERIQNPTGEPTIIGHKPRLVIRQSCGGKQTST